MYVHMDVRTYAVHTYVCTYVILYVRIYIHVLYVRISVATILLEVYHDDILLSRHVSRYVTISVYCEQCWG